MAVLLIIAIFFNRRSQVVLAGILAVAGLDLSLMLNLASYPQISEQVLLPGQTMIPAKLIDLQLMVVLSGQERHEAQYRALFETAGLNLIKAWPTHSPYSILEGLHANL